jgi:type IV secretion system protein TrbB
MTERPMQALIAEAVNLIVVIQKMPEGRRVTELLEIHGFDGRSYQFKSLK